MKIKIGLIVSVIFNALAICFILNQNQTRAGIQGKLEIQRENTKLAIMVSEKWKSAAAGCLSDNKEILQIMKKIRSL